MKKSLFFYCVLFCFLQLSFIRSDSFIKPIIHAFIQTNSNSFIVLDSYTYFFVLKKEKKSGKNREKSEKCCSRNQNNKTVKKK